MQRRLYNAVPYAVIDKVFQKPKALWEQLLEQGNIAQSSAQYLDKQRHVLKEGLTAFIEKRSPEWTGR